MRSGLRWELPCDGLVSDLVVVNDSTAHNLINYEQNLDLCILIVRRIQYSPENLIDIMMRYCHLSIHSYRNIFLLNKIKSKKHLTGEILTTKRCQHFTLYVKRKRLSNCLPDIIYKLGFLAIRCILFRLYA